MTYVMSDLHGCRKQFHQMLTQISFSANDHLYILGDIIDRGPDGIGLLQDIMAMPNVTVLLGNHELWFQEVLFGGKDIWFTKKEWFDNGGQSTWECYRSLSREQRIAIFDFIRSLPDHLDVEINGKQFHLVHGFPGDTESDRVWGRPTAGGSAPIPGKTVIIGHTPTPFLDVNQLATEAKIVHLPGVIDIDCGSVCCFNGQLACLRLEDMAEFYVPIDV